MAFDWIKAADLATSGLELAQAFGGRGESGESKSARKSARQARKLAAAAADPTSRRFQNLAGIYDEENRRDIIEAIDRVMRVSARARARGDTGFGVNPERRDESRYRAIAKAFLDSKEASRREARNTLLSASRSIAGSAGALPVATGEARAGENFDLRTTGLTSVVPFAQQLAGFFDNPTPRFSGGYRIDNTKPTPPNALRTMHTSYGG